MSTSYAVARVSRAEVFMCILNRNDASSSPVACPVGRFSFYLCASPGAMTPLSERRSILANTTGRGKRDAEKFCVTRLFMFDGASVSTQARVSQLRCCLKIIPRRSRLRMPRFDVPFGDRHVHRHESPVPKSVSCLHEINADNADAYFGRMAVQ